MDSEMEENDAPFDELYARQMYVYGREGTARLAAATALVVGARGVGAEVGACASYAR